MKTILNLSPSQIETLSKLVLSITNEPPERLEKRAEIPASLLVNAVPQQIPLPSPRKAESKWVAEELPWWLIP